MPGKDCDQIEKIAKVLGINCGALSREIHEIKDSNGISAHVCFVLKVVTGAIELWFDDKLFDRIDLYELQAPQNNSGRGGGKDPHLRHAMRKRG